ncbi:hypothetical protein SOM61_24830 [Massilia sp. CFBP9012]|uniref:hypothetical protein n=1 Tax=Massilia sp. CFBP9012 TaxID=3096531 RepID=UPI002A6A0F28|nr:hypothetical protein [Massilia sp. CFBP9012]MDY0978194.1 hypothetical protein [Massilia sp. CFBP9012]
MAIVATHVAAVQELYVAYFGRPADPAGLDYWTNVVQAQAGSTTAVSAAFATQPEYIVAYFGKTNAQVVDQIYLNLFGRGTSTTDGRAYWVDLLNKGTVGVSTIVAEVANGAQGSDGVAFENKVEAATAFTAALDTAAEQAGYAGADSLALAKTWISSITTDATLTAAIAPTALNAQVAAVVKAGTPFALESGIAALRAADKAIADFVKANDLDAATAESALNTAAATAETNLAGKVPGYAAATTDRAKAAALADQQEKLTKEAKAANDELADARGDASAKAVAAADALARATAAQTAADKAEDAALLKQNAAEAFLEASIGGTRAVTVGAEEITVVPTTGVTPVVLARINVDTGAVTVASGITETAYPGIGALATAVRDYNDALLVQSGAVKAVAAANKTISDDLSDADEAAAVAIAPLATTAAEATKAVSDLAKLVTALSAADAKVDAYADLVDARDVAVADFADGGFLAPVTLTAASAALTGSDVFLLGSVDSTVTGFGTSGDDVIYVGKNFTFNAGGLDKGVDTAMEIFFVQNGNRAEIHVEKAAYGSTSDDIIVISLVGVDATDLQLTDGVISLKDA